MSQTELHSKKLVRADVRHGFATRSMGDALDSLVRWEEVTGLSEQSLVILKQMHGTDVLVVDRPAPQVRALPECNFDAAITDRKDVVLSVRTADCAPIFLFCPRPQAIGVVHAGWRGTLAGTVTYAITRMQDVFGCPPSNLQVAIGPCIHSCCYQVGADVYKPFLARFGTEAVSVLGSNTYVNLVAANRIWLTECGVRAESVDLIDYCTSCRHDLFFSHRRDGTTAGRLLNYLTLSSSL